MSDTAPYDGEECAALRELKKKNFSSSTLSVANSQRRPILPKLFSDLVYVTLGFSFFTLPVLRGVSYARLSLSDFNTKSKYILPVKVDVRIVN